MRKEEKRRKNEEIRGCVSWRVIDKVFGSSRFYRDFGGFFDFM